MTTTLESDINLFSDAALLDLCPREPVPVVIAGRAI
jgi:hypothetical protein